MAIIPSYPLNNVMRSYSCEGKDNVQICVSYIVEECACQCALGEGTLGPQLVNQHPPAHHPFDACYNQLWMNLN